MRGKRNFINYKRKLLTKVDSIKFINRPHKYYQPQNTGSYFLITRKGSLLKESWKNPLLKIARKQLKKRSFLTVSSSMTYKSTSKPIGVRMGKGKGKIDQSVMVTKRNQKLLSFNEVSLINIEKLFKLLSGRTSCNAGLSLVSKTY